MQITRKGGRSSGLDTNIYPEGRRSGLLTRIQRILLNILMNIKEMTVNKEIKWKDGIIISGNTIKRNIIKYNFANYPVH